MEGISRTTKFLVGAASFVITIPALKFALQPEYKVYKEFPTRTAIVTGATGNLGQAISYSLALKKVRVILACRNMENCKSLRRELVMITNNKAIACRHLDLEDIDSINRFADDMIANEPHIDILINNAAVKEVKEKEMTKYGIEKNYFVNFIAPYLLTFRLLEKLKESAAITRDSRIINVIGTPKSNWNVDLADINFDKRKYNSRAAYEQSKLALAYFTILLEEFNRKQKNFVYVFGTSPIFEWIYDSLWQPVGFSEQAKTTLYNYFYFNPQRAISVTLRCALDPSLNYTGSGKLYTYFCRSWGWPWVVKNKEKAKLVWNLAAQSLLNIPEKSKELAPSSDEKNKVKVEEKDPATITTNTATTTTNSNNK